MTVFISAFAGRVRSVVPKVKVVLAVTSATCTSFPVIPTCNGTQSICAARLFFFLLQGENFHIDISDRNFEMPDFVACMALRKSVSITDFGILVINPLYCLLKPY